MAGSGWRTVRRAGGEKQPRGTCFGFGGRWETPWTLRALGKTEWGWGWGWGTVRGFIQNRPRFPRSHTRRREREWGLPGSPRLPRHKAHPSACGGLPPRALGHLAPGTVTTTKGLASFLSLHVSHSRKEQCENRRFHPPRGCLGRTDVPGSRRGGENAPRCGAG